MTIERYYKLIISENEFKMLIDSIDLTNYSFSYIAIMTVEGDIEYAIEISEQELENIVEEIAYAIYENENIYGYRSTEPFRKFRYELCEALEA